MRKKLFIFGLLLAACSSRAASTTDADPSHDLAPSYADGPDVAVDLSLPKDGGAGPFCSGGPKVKIGDELLGQSNIAIQTGAHSWFSCCWGDFIRFSLLDSVGDPVQVTAALLLTLDSGSYPQSPIDLSNPPEGFWALGIDCEPRDRCGRVDSESSDITGSIELEQPSDEPVMYVSLCVTSTPRSTADPSVRPVKIFANRVPVNMACEFGLDQTCNHDVAVSSFKGTCNEDRTCTCMTGATKNPTTGKCQ